MTHSQLFQQLFFKKHFFPKTHRTHGFFHGCYPLRKKITVWSNCRMLGMKGAYKICGVNYQRSLRILVGDNRLKYYYTPSADADPFVSETSRGRFASAESADLTGIEFAPCCWATPHPLGSAAPWMLSSNTLPASN